MLSINSTASGSGYGVYAISATTTNGTDIYALNDGTGNTGYAGYFTNTSTGVLNFGLYASTSSASGWAGYFDGAVNVAGNLTVSSCTGCSGAGSNALSAITSATTTNSIDSTNMAQIWKWGTLSTQTALTLSTSSMTSGALLNLSDTSAGSGGTVLSIADSQTGPTYGVASSLTGSGNTGYGGYFSNTSTAGWALAVTNTAYFNGYVGIGTSAPGSRLEVNGNITLTSGGGQTLTTPGTSLVLQQTGDTYGTTALTLENRSGLNGALFQDSGVDLVDFGFLTSASVQGNIRFEHRNTSIEGTNNATNGEFQFLNPNSGGSPIYWATFGQSTAYFNENVGIGTANPTDTFVTSWGTTGNEMHVYNEATSGHGDSYGGVVLSNKYLNSGSHYEGAFIKFGQESATSPQGNLALGTGNGSTTTTSVYLTSTGSVGIGTTSPTGLLSINSTTTGTGYGVYTLSATTTNGYGAYSLLNGVGNTGYAGYFTNTSTGVANYGLYASTSSATGYAGYFQGPVNVAGNITVTSCTGCAAAGSNALSAITSATTTNSIDSTNMAQTWNWGTLSTQTALTLSTSSMTSGTLLALTNTNAGNSTGTVLSVSNATSGAGYGISSAMSNAGNSGYAGYFTSNAGGPGFGLLAGGNAIYAANSTTTGNYGSGAAVYGYESGSGNNAAAGFFFNNGGSRGLYAGTQNAGTAIQGETQIGGGVGVMGDATATSGVVSTGVQGTTTINSAGGGATGYGVYGANTTFFGGANTVYGVYGTNSEVAGSGPTTYGVYGTDAYGNYGVYGSQTKGSGGGYAGYFTNNSTGAGFGMYGSEIGAANTGYAGYFANTGTGSVNYGLYASTSSASGYAGYFQGAVNVAGNLTVSSCTGCLGAGANSLSALTSATTTNSIDNAAYGQTWSWNSLSSGTAFTISSNSMTTGSLLSLQDTAAAATSTGKVLSISDATTGAGYGISSAMTGLGTPAMPGISPIPIPPTPVTPSMPPIPARDTHLAPPGMSPSTTDL